MSYSSDLKKRLTLSELRSKCCASAELYAAFLMNGSAVLPPQRKTKFAESMHWRRKAEKNRFKEGFYQNQEHRRPAVGSGNRFAPAADPESILRKDCCCAAFLRGCFLRSGYITSPDRPARADIAFKDERALQICRNALERLKFDIICRYETGKSLYI